MGYAPDINIAGSTDSTWATDTENSMFNLLDRAELTSTNTMVLYAKTKPTSTFYIRVSGLKA
jgi:hypothetical protein